MSEGKGGDARWGVWGPEDERGAANLLSPDRVRLSLSREFDGRVLELGAPIDADLAVYGERMRPRHRMVNWFGAGINATRAPTEMHVANDVIELFPHGTTSHVDALCHVWFDDLLYNGHPASAVTAEGATRCDIAKAGPFVGRGVLLEFASEGPVAADTQLSARDISGALERQGISLAMGDVVLIHTGYDHVRFSDERRFNGAHPGITLDAAEMMAEAGVVAIGADNLAIEYVSGEVAQSLDVHELPVHRYLLRNRGVYLIELLDLRELSASHASEFLFVMAPLRVIGGTASPVNPLAVL